MNKKISGFTLVEVMVVVSLVAILFLVGSPLTSGWTTSAEVTSAKGVLNEAIGRAKSLAIRNQQGIDSDKSTAAICISNDNKLEVRYASTAATTHVNCDNNVGTVDWKSSVSTNLTIKVGSTKLSCLCFDSKSQLNNSAASCTACAASTTVTISAAGVTDETVSIY